MHSSDAASSSGCTFRQVCQWHVHYLRFTTSRSDHKFLNLLIAKATAVLLCK